MANENMNQQDQHKQQDVEIKERLRHIKNKILVMSGKGGGWQEQRSSLSLGSLSQEGLQGGSHGRGPSRSQYPAHAGPERKYRSGYQ